MQSHRTLGLQKRWIAGAVMGLAVVAVGSGVRAHYYLTGPRAAAEAFLHCCREKNYDGLYRLLDTRYRELFTPPASRSLLAMLHRHVPRAFRVTAANHPSALGLVTDRNRYHVRVKLEEPEEARQAHRSFVITLVREGDGGWRVAFQPTYQSLFAGLYDSAGEEYLYRVLWHMAGARGHRLWHRVSAPG